jgi:hypothetical protein
MLANTKAQLPAVEMKADYTQNIESKTPKLPV